MQIVLYGNGEAAMPSARQVYDVPEDVPYCISQYIDSAGWGRCAMFFDTQTAMRVRIRQYNGSNELIDDITTTVTINNTYHIAYCSRTLYSLALEDTRSYTGVDICYDATNVNDLTSLMAIQAAREHFDTPTGGYCDFAVYTLGEGHNTLYTLVAKNLEPQDPYIPNDYEIWVGVTSTAEYDGANIGTFPYIVHSMDMSYDDLYYSMFESERAQADEQGYFFITAALRHNENNTAVIDDTFKFRIVISTGGITSEESQTGGTVNIYIDTPAEQDDTFDPTVDDIAGQAPGQNLSIDNLLTTSYVLTDSSLQAFGRYIWNNDLTTQVYQYQSSPIENILSCRRIPFAETGTATTEIKLGNVAIPIPANKCESLHRFQMSEFSLPTDKFTPWLAFTDFVQVSIYLPYCGIQKIPNNYCFKKAMNGNTPTLAARTLKVEYIYDVIFGTCAACLFVKDGNNWVMFAVYNGSCAIDIPITASNRAEIELGLIKTGVNGAAESMNKIVQGATSFNPLAMVTGAINTAFSTYSQMKADQITADMHYQTSGAFSSQVASLMSQDAYVFMQYPDFQYESTYAHEQGKPCNLTLNLSGLTGYTEIDHGVDLSSIPCFDDEKIYLEQALTSGFYL